MALAIKLSVPYFDQLENSDHPWGSCNVTSLAMALLFLGAKPRNIHRFPDELDEYCDAHGLDRHSPQDLATVASAYGIKDHFSTSNTIESVKTWLRSGKPAIVHGYFSQSGHIICLIGCDDTGFFVNDPYGNWFADGYDRNDANNETKGKGLHYSNELIQRVCIGDDKSFWVHLLEKGS
jgi:uncharacterized protein YvpB